MNAVQLHGDESVEFCERLNEKIMVIKAVGISEEQDVRRALEYRKFPVLLDTKVSGYGVAGRFSTGQLFCLTETSFAISYFPED